MCSIGSMGRGRVMYECLDASGLIFMYVNKVNLARVGHIFHWRVLIFVTIHGAHLGLWISVGINDILFCTHNQMAVIKKVISQA